VGVGSASGEVGEVEYADAMTGSESALGKRSTILKEGGGKGEGQFYNTGLRGCTKKKGTATVCRKGVWRARLRQKKERKLGENTKRRRAMTPAENSKGPHFALRLETPLRGGKGRGKKGE